MNLLPQQPDHLLRRAQRKAIEIAHAATAPVRTLNWEPYSRLLPVRGAAFWSVAEDMSELARTAERLDVPVASGFYAPYTSKQFAFYGNHFQGLQAVKHGSDHRIGIAYYHGKPGTGKGEFDEAFNLLENHHEELWVVQVTHDEMREIVLSSGIDPAKVHKIPIGIDIDSFPYREAERSAEVRERLDIPDEAFVIGSFQKDGEGWGKGTEPKLIKGPDVLLETLSMLKSSVSSSLWVLLSGPARGYVKQGLEDLSIPYRHRFLDDPKAIADFYQAIDAYVIPSRQEGGPKPVLESMATGTPLVTTAVGQATELVRHQKNGWIVDVGDADGLAYWLRQISQNPERAREVTRRARETAQNYDYRQLDSLWAEVFESTLENSP